MRIVIDIDDVLADFGQAALTRFGEDCDQTEWDLTVRWPHLTDSILTFVADASEYANLEPVPGSVDAVNFFLHRGDKVYLVSARPGNNEMFRITEEWLRKHGYVYEELILTADKAQTVGMINPAFAIDDSPAQVVSIRNAGIPCAVFDRPYNRHLPGPRIKNWPSFIQAIGVNVRSS